MRLFFIKNAISFVFCRKQKLSRTVASFLVFLLGVLQPFTPFVVSAQSTLQANVSQGILLSDESSGSSTPGLTADVPSYSQLITEFVALQDGKDNFGSISDSDRETRRVRLLAQYEQYIEFERTRLRELGIHPGRQKQHLEMLEGQMRALGGTPTFIDKVKDFVEEKILGRSNDGITQALDKKEQEETPPPLEHPSSFTAPEHPVVLERTENLVGVPQAGQKIPETIKKILSIEEVEAAANSTLPTLDDTRADGSEVLITDEIRELALSLNNNPVEIFNYLSNTILYEPYAGAVKGSVGCLKEKACNDIDSSSLAIALLRASGIPSRYSKSLAVFTFSQMREMLGVESPRSVIQLIGNATVGKRIAIYEIAADGSEQPLVGDVQNVDLSRVSSLAIEWVHPEAYVQYDERGANYPNTLDVSQSATTEELLSLLSRFPTLQWTPFDVVVKPHRHTKVEILSDTAGIDAMAFWNGYLASSSSGSPVRAYADQVRQKTGKDIFDPALRSSRSIKKRTLPVLPPVTPYILATGGLGSTEITLEKWSRLPDTRRVSMVISIHKASDASGIFEQKWFASMVNNTELTLSYQGASDQDKATIKDFDGIAATPPSLVSVIPALSFGDTEILGQNGIGIGTKLILRFTVALDGEEINVSEKYSVAGNTEGIYAVFSHPQQDPRPSSPDAIMMRGPAAIARAYIDQTLSDARIFSDALDYRYAPKFIRAVVTDNRVIALQGGAPISFEFSGLTLDATELSNGASGRGDFKDHQKEFYLIGKGLNASYYESQIFADLAGLDGVSTVTGLQYASSRPSEYTVKTITSQNSGEIDSFDLPANTKQQMKEEASKGNTIVTPTKKVSIGGWNGVFYVSLRPDSTALYAIGEQTTSNGGFSTDKFRLATWKDETSGKTKQSHQVTKDRIQKGTVQRVQFIQKEDAARSIKCTIAETTFNSIVSGGDASGWSQTKYGVPCYEEKLSFGDNDHRFVVATDGAYFKSVKRNYDYWKNNSDIQATFLPRIARVPPMRQLFAYWGTYAYTLEETPDLTKPSIFRALAVYSPSAQRTYRIESPMAERYMSNEMVLDKNIPELLGFPTGNKENAAQYIVDGTKGFYQQFINGTLYQRDRWWPVDDDVFPVIGKINELHTIVGGTEIAGFPVSDPQWSVDGGGKSVQQFQIGEKYSYTPGAISAEREDASRTISIKHKFSDEEIQEFTEGMQDAAFDEGIAIAVDVVTGASLNVVLMQIKDAFAKKFVKKMAERASTRLVPGVGIVITGVLALTIPFSVLNQGPLYDACNFDPEIRVDGKPPAYYCGQLAVRGISLLVGFVGPSVAKNLYGVKSPTAKAGKNMFYGAIADEKSLDINEIRPALTKNKELREGFFEAPKKINASAEDIKNVVKSKPKLRRALSSRFGLTREMLVSDLEPKLPAGYKDVWSGIHDKISVALKDSTYSSYGSLKVAYWKKFAELPEAKDMYSDDIINKIKADGTSPTILINGKQEQIKLHHLLPQKVSKEDIVNLENIFPIPNSVHKWTHYEADGPTKIRFGPLQQYQEPDLKD